MLNNTQKNINASLKKIWLQSLSKLPHNSQKGQTFPTAIALGFIGMSAGALTLVNAGNEQQNIIAQQGASQAQNITEAGIAKSLNTFTQGNNQYLLLASYGQNGWLPVDANDLDLDGDNSYSDDIDINNANGCGEVNGTTKLDTNPDAINFINNLVNNNTVISNIENAGVGSGSSAGSYMVKSYTYDKNNNQGELIIQGQNSLNTQNKAQYQVTFAVNTSPSTPSTSTSGGAAALMGKNMNTRGMAIFADTIICTDPLTPGNCGNDVTINSSYCQDGLLTVNSSNNYSDLSSDELAEYSLLETMMGSTNNGFRAPDNKKITDIVIASTPIPPTPIAPTGANIINVDVGTGTVNTIVASLNNPSTMIASIKDNNIVANNWKTVFSSAFNHFWGWIDSPAYAGNPNFDNSSYVTNAQTALSQIQGFVTQAQASVASIEALAISYPNNTNISNALSTAQSALSSAQSALSTAQSAVSSAQSANNANQGNSAVNDANSALSSAQTAASDAQAQYNLGVAASTTPPTPTTPTPPTPTGSITISSGAASIDLSQAPFSTSFVEEYIDGVLHHAIYIQVNNVSGRAGDINVVINETALEAITVNGNNIDTEKMIVRLYIGEDMTFSGNDAIQVYDGSNNRITGATEKERNQIASLRIIGGNANGTAVGNLTWDMNGTGCLMGHVHAPTVTLSLPQGNGCGNSGGETPIALNTVAENEYGSGNVNSIGSNIATPNVFGAIWAANITNSSSGSSASFYENSALTKKLASEFGAANPGVTGAGASSTSVQMSAGINSIVRQAAQ